MRRGELSQRSRITYIIYTAVFHDILTIKQIIVIRQYFVNDLKNVTMV